MIDNKLNGVYIVNTENKLNSPIDVEATYMIFIHKIIDKFDNNDFDDHDLLLGKLDYFYHKSKNYKKDKASYDYIPFNNEIKINLSKDKDSKYWGYLSLKNKTDTLKFLPAINHKSSFEKIGLVIKEIKYDKEYNTYNYTYLYKNRVRIEFMVDEKYFTKQTYPENYRAISMWKL